MGQKRICKDACCVAGAVQETHELDMLGGRGAERGCKVFRFAKMILRDRCSTSHDLASLFRGRRGTLDRWNGKIAKRVAQLSVFEGSLAELLRFGCCQVQKLRRSRRNASFSSLQIDR